MCLFPYGLSFIRVESLRYIPEPCCLLSSSKHPPHPPQEFPACLLALFVGLCLPLFRAVFSCNRQGPTSSQGNILPKKVGWKGLGLTWSPPTPQTSHPTGPPLTFPPAPSLSSICAGASAAQLQGSGCTVALLGPRAPRLQLCGPRRVPRLRARLLTLVRRSSSSRLLFASMTSDGFCSRHSFSAGYVIHAGLGLQAKRRTGSKKQSGGRFGYHCRVALQPALLALSDQQAGGVPAEVAAAMFEASDIYRLLKTAGRK